MLTPTAITFINAQNLADIVPLVPESVGTFSFDETDNTEQILIDLTVSQRTIVNAFWLDMSNCTRNVTLRVFHEIDGSNRREYQENIWTTVDDDGVLVAGAVFDNDVRFTLQCDGLGAGNVDIPYTVL